MSLIDDRIAQFRAEVGDRELTEEQRKIFNAFTKKNGSLVRIHIVDVEGVSLRVSMDSSAEVKKVLTKHYCTPDGTVTAVQILDMFDTVRTGRKYMSMGNIIYEKAWTCDGALYFTVLKVFSNGKDAVFKSFYSTIGYK